MGLLCMKMEDEVFSILHRCIVNVLPELEGRAITMHDSLKELGANSIDRAEIIVQGLSALSIRAPLITFGQARNIAELVALFCGQLKGETVA